MSLIKKRTSQRQFAIILNFLEKNRDLTRDSWSNLTKILNLDDSGPKKSIYKWKKTVWDWKKSVRTKYARIAAANANHENDEDLESETLSPLEKRLLKLIKSDQERKLTQFFQSQDEEREKFLKSQDKLRQKILQCQETHAEISPSTLNGDDISNPSCSFIKLEIESEEEEDNSEEPYNLEDITENGNNSYENKSKKRKISSENEEDSESSTEENEERLFQERMLEAEEQKADALQRIAVSFESIAASIELLCQSFIDKR